MFKKYALIYDLFNIKKKYKLETDYLLKLVKKFEISKSKNFLDLGCGTGKHASCLRNKVNYISGVDISEEMLKIARKNFPNILFKNLKYKHQIKFDVCFSFFHVFSYLKNDKQINNYLSYASKNLKKDGLLIFDYWLKSSVIKDPPKEKVKYLKFNNQNILRYTDITQIKNLDLINIFFKFFIVKNKKVNFFKEKHEMRYFSEKKIKQYLKKNNFRLIKNFEWLKIQSPKNKWYACIIAKKI